MTDDKQPTTTSHPHTPIPQTTQVTKLINLLNSSFIKTSIMIWDYDGTILATNAVADRGFVHLNVSDPIGKNFQNLYQKDWALERLTLARRAIDSDTAIQLLEILGGYRLRTHFQPLNAFDSDSNQILVTSEQITYKEYNTLITDPQFGELVHAEYNDLGRMSVLTTRELEVLALMGQGMRSKAIAKEIHRSEKTVRNHKENISNKLGFSDRSKLIELAQHAALRVEDANCKQVQFYKNKV